MPLDLIAPVYTSYAYQYNGGIIYTQQSINEFNNSSLFSTITHPGRPHKHCWTTGHIEGDQYVFRSESTDIGNPGSTEIFTTAFPLPLTCKLFIIPFPSPSLYIPPSHSTPLISPEPKRYGPRMIPLPNNNSTRDLGSNSFDFYSDTLDPTSELTAPLPSVPLREAQLPLRPDSPHKQGHQGSEEEVLSPSQGNGATGACFWSSFHMDRRLDGSYQHSGQ